MYRRDLITAEIQKLSQVLARIMGLKLEGKIIEADDLFAESLQKDFGLSLEKLYSDDRSSFELFLNETGYAAEKLQTFSEFIFIQFDPSAGDLKNYAIAEKLLIIYDLLESKHHIVNMTNLDRQKAACQYLNIKKWKS